MDGLGKMLFRASLGLTEAAYEDATTSTTRASEASQSNGSRQISGPRLNGSPQHPGPTISQGRHLSGALDPLPLAKSSTATGESAQLQQRQDSKEGPVRQESKGAIRQSARSKSGEIAGFRPKLAAESSVSKEKLSQHEASDAASSPPSTEMLTCIAQSMSVLAESVQASEEELRKVSAKADAVHTVQQSILTNMGYLIEELLKRELKAHMAGIRDLVEGLNASNGAKCQCHEETQTEGIHFDLHTMRVGSKRSGTSADADEPGARIAHLMSQHYESGRSARSNRSNMIAPASAKALELALSNHPSDDGLDSENWRNILQEVEDAQLRNRLHQPGGLYEVFLALGVPRSRLPRPRLETTPLEEFVSGAAFMTISTLAIILNTIFVGVEADNEMKNALMGVESPDWFAHVNRLFVGFFATELVIRIGALRAWYFLGQEWKWNAIDVFIVAVSIFWETQGGSGSSGSVARIIRIVRLLRVGKVLRQSPFLQELRTLANGLFSAAAPLGWGALVLALLTYTFAVLFLQGAAEFVHHNRTSLDPHDQETIEFVKEWYSSLEDAMFTLFYAISGGASWSDLSRPLTSISSLNRLVFSIYILLAALGVLKLFTAVFVVSLSRLEAKDNAAVIQGQISKDDCFMDGLWRLILETNRGKKEVRKVVAGWWLQGFLRDERVQAFLSANQLDWRDVAKLYGDAKQSEQMFSVDDFVLDCARLRGEARSFDISCLQKNVAKLDGKLQHITLLLQQSLAQEEKMLQVEEEIVVAGEASIGIASPNAIARQAVRSVPPAEEEKDDLTMQLTI